MNRSIASEYKTPTSGPPQKERGGSGNLLARLTFAAVIFGSIVANQGCSRMFPVTESPGRVTGFTHQSPEPKEEPPTRSPTPWRTATPTPLADSEPTRPPLDKPPEFEIPAGTPTPAPQSTPHPTPKPKKPNPAATPGMQKGFANGVVGGTGNGGPFQTDRPTATPAASPEILPTFFPPKATSTVELSINFAQQNLTLARLSDEISLALTDAGYERRSYFWLDQEHGPGFAIITHIEQIQVDGFPVTTGRWSFDLPTYENFSITSFLKAMIKADPGNYRMIALVVSLVPFQEKDEAITEAQVAKLNAGPKFLAETADSKVTVNPSYHCIAYIYEFERSTRNDDPKFKVSSDVSASEHLKSTPLWAALARLR